jgi:hypothetical protein
LRAVARGETALPRVLTTRFVEQLRQASMADAQRPKHQPIRGTLFYVPRFTRHFYRRLRAHQSVSLAWSSARDRMRMYP